MASHSSPGASMGNHLSNRNGSWGKLEFMCVLIARLWECFSKVLRR